MTQLQTAHFGSVEYRAEDVIAFPAGVPAFEEEKQFLLMEQPRVAPLLMLQSLHRPELVFPALPARLVDPGYSLALGEEDLLALELPLDRQPDIGSEVLCLVVVTIPESGEATANLLAPVLVNLKTMRGRQVIQTGSEYSHRHPLAIAGEAPCL